MGYAFISYSSKNQSSADAMRKLLNDEGIETWMAPGDIPVGSSYLKEINRALKNCSCLVLLLSNAAQVSQWVIKEVEKAVKEQKPIIPVQIEDVIMNDEFEFVLGTYQVCAVQKIDWNSEEVENVIRSVRAAAGSTGERRPSTVTVPEEPPETKAPPGVFEGLIFEEQKRQEEEVRVLLERYPRITDLRYVASGYSGDVFMGYDAEKDMQIAIKTFRSTAAFYVPLFCSYSLFMDLKSLSHPNLCRVLDRELQEPFCVVMESAPGRTMKEYLPFLSSGDPDELLKIALGILNGLKALHVKNIFYGDLTPNNVIVDSDGSVRLCDFSESNYNGSRCLDKSIILDKYRSPEKNIGNTLDSRSDIYEFGVILTDLLSAFVLDDDYVGGMLYDIIKKCTKKQPEERYQSVDEIIDRIMLMEGSDI